MSLALFGIVAALAVPPPACQPLVTAATWDAGRLYVAPSRCGRRVAARHPRRVFRAAIAAGGRGAPNRRSLYRQFRCHVVFAPSKRTWNLETWRPHVSWPQMIVTGCNP